MSAGSSHPYGREPSTSAGPSLPRPPNPPSTSSARQQANSESMLRRMAGQSVNKAGLAMDQSEINRIILEASKGSKFYENERKKDEELGRKINATLKKRDELLPGADIPKLEADCDRIISELEAGRDLTRTIVHVDLDAFFASVEQIADPSLTGTAFGVGGGVLTTASYEARKYGVRSGMAGFVAKKLCPHLNFVKPHFDEYMKWSAKVFAVARRYDPNLAKAGCDEGYLDITGYMDEHKMASEQVVEHFRAACVAETGLTVSAGIAPNKMLAKICSDINKPNGQYSLPFTAPAVRDFTRTLKIRKVPGIGKVSERILESLGIITCGDIITHRAMLHLLDFGVTDLLRSALGCCSNKVEPGKRSDRKSVGVESTFRDMTKREDIVRKLEEIADELVEHLTSLRFAGRTLVLKYKTHEYKSFTRNKTPGGYEFKGKDEIWKIAMQLLEPELPLRIRLIGLRVMNLRDLDIELKGGLDSFVTRSPPKAKAKKALVKAPKRAMSEGGSDASNAIALDLSADEGVSTDDEDGMKKFGDAAVLGEELATDGELGLLSDEGGSAEDEPVAKESQTCPVCSHKFKPTSTNDEVNTHVDTCLSRQAISDLASTAHSSPATKPRSKSKRDEVVVSDSDSDARKVAAAPKKRVKKAATPKPPAIKPKNAFELMMKGRGGS